MSWQQRQDLEITCPIHNEPIVSISLTSQPKCSKCLAQTEIPINQFVKNIEKYRSERISMLKQFQQQMQKKIEQLRKLLIMNKEQFVRAIDDLIKNIDFQLQNMMGEVNTEMNELTQSMNSLGISQLQQYQKKLSSKNNIHSKEEQLDQIHYSAVGEYEKLIAKTNIIKQLYDLQHVVSNSSQCIHPQLCVEGLQSDNLQLQIGQLPKDELTTARLVIPLICECPPQCNCNKQQPRLWLHGVCGDNLFINDQGDIFCRNFTNKSECSSFFIQQAKFKCKQTDQEFSYCYLGQFLTAFARSIQNCTYGEIVDFGMKMNKSMLTRWQR